MYLQRGGRAGGIFNGTDDDPVFVGEYTHTGNYTPAQRGDDKLVWVGEYTHVGALTPDQAQSQLYNKLLAMSDAAFAAAKATDQSKVAAAKGTGLSMTLINRTFLKAAKARQPSGGGSGGGSSGGGSSGGLFDSLSPSVLVGGAAVVGVLGLVAMRMGGGARSNPRRRRRNPRRRR